MAATAVIHNPSGYIFWVDSIAIWYRMIWYLILLCVITVGISLYICSLEYAQLFTIILFTHSDPVTRHCVVDLCQHWSDNGLSRVRQQVIIWASVGLSTESWEQTLVKFESKYWKFPLLKMRLRMPSAKYQGFYWDLDVVDCMGVRDTWVLICKVIHTGDPLHNLIEPNKILQHSTELHTNLWLGGVLQGWVCYSYNWPSTQPST